MVLPFRSLTIAHTTPNGMTGTPLMASYPVELYAARVPRWARVISQFSVAREFYGQIKWRILKSSSPMPEIEIRDQV